ncbi:MAG: PleD family two-component system response regulator [Mariniblastus sp.]
MSKVLIIDDSRAMRKILGKIMKNLGFEVLEAGHGQEGIVQLEEHKDELELVLVDWNMPVMNGYEFVQAVREQDVYANHKLVMVTTETEPTQMVKALMAGVDEFVMKPFTSDILIEKLQLIGVNMPESQAT